MSFSPIRSALLCLCVALSPLAGGCAATAQTTFMQERAGQFVYEHPMAEVWPAARQLLQQEGYSGREIKQGWVYVTEWDERIPGNFIRYLIQGQELGPNRCVVRFMRAARGSNVPAPDSKAGVSFSQQENQVKIPESATPSLGGGKGGEPALLSGTRDLEMEWKLLVRLEPARAAAIQEEARQKYP